jgi:hypothetical protein
LTGRRKPVIKAERGETVMSRMIFSTNNWWWWNFRGGVCLLP